MSWDCRYSNLPAPTSERAAMNERNLGTFGISEFMPPASGELS